jgi:hypothetical protein
MKMNPGKADEEFVLEQLQDIFQLAYNDALFEILQTIAKHVGIVDLNGLSIGDFFDRRRREIAENLIADSADTFPALASQMKLAWKKLDREQVR